MTCDEVEVCDPIVVLPGTAPDAYPRPAYSDKFRCLAQACDENCCNGWTIPIDQNTLDTYRQHPTLKPFVNALVVLNTEAPQPGNVASMPLTHHGTCAFLNEEKLCGIHAHFGPTLLSNACATYPREIDQQSGHSEAALNLSCPEAARLTLLDPTLLGSGPWQAFGPRRYTHLPHSTRLPSGFDPVLALRELALLLITDPTYPLWKRMRILFELTQRLELLAGGSSTREWVRTNAVLVARLIDDITDAAAFHTLSMPAGEPNPSMQLRFAAEILRSRLAQPPVPEPFMAIVRTFQVGLGCAPDRQAPLSDLQISQTFSSAYRHHVRPLLDRHPHLIENFLINYIFKYAYPFGRSRNAIAPPSPTHQHLALVANLALTQTLLVGLAAHHRGRLSPEHVVHLIQATSKAIEHRPASAAQLSQSLQAHNLTSPEAQAQLLHLA